MVFQPGFRSLPAENHLSHASSSTSLIYLRSRNGYQLQALNSGHQSLSTGNEMVQRTSKLHLHWWFPRLAGAMTPNPVR